MGAEFGNEIKQLLELLSKPEISSQIRRIKITWKSMVVDSPDECSAQYQVVPNIDIKFKGKPWIYR